MLFIVFCAVSALIVAGLLIRPLLRARDRRADLRAQDVAFYKAQLRELDRDVARGTITPDEAERARAEIARRLLAADRAAPQSQSTAPRGATAAVAAVIGVTLILGAGALYWWAGEPAYGDQPLKGRIAASSEARANRPSQAEAVAEMGELPRPVVEDDYAQMVAQLRAAAKDRPDDLRGQQLLARHEAQLGNYEAAITAQRNVLRLKGDDARPDDKLMLLDLMVFQTRGFVSPEAETLAKEILEDDPGNVGAIYYLGLLYDGTDRPDRAFEMWREIIESGSRAPHAMMARRMIEQAAERAGLRYALPDLEAPGPSQADVAAAQNLSPKEQAEMIRGMVAQLSERLAQQGGSAEEWARLISALGVLDETDEARAIWTEAQERFADKPELETIRAAAEQAGVAE